MHLVTASTRQPVQPLQAVPAKVQVCSSGSVMVCRAVVGAAPCRQGLCLGTRSEARCFLQPAAGGLPCSGALLQQQNKKRAFAFFSLAFRVQALSMGFQSALGTLKKLHSALGFTLNITASRVRPIPRAAGNLILIFFRCCGFLGRSSGRVQLWAGCVRSCHFNHHVL